MKFPQILEKDPSDPVTKTTTSPSRAPPSSGARAAVWLRIESAEPHAQSWPGDLRHVSLWLTVYLRIFKVRLKKHIKSLFFFPNTGCCLLPPDNPDQIPSFEACHDETKVPKCSKMFQSYFSYGIPKVHMNPCAHIP